MERALIYTTVGKSQEYLRCLEWFCKSLMYTSRTTINLLVICDISFHTTVVNTLKRFAFLNYYVMDVPNSTTSEEASKHKTKIFEFPQVFHFSKILFVDLDCLFLGDITSILSTPVNDNKLYVWPERIIVEKNNLVVFSLSREDNKNVCYYNDAHWNFLNKHNKLPFNAGLFMFRSSKLMEQHFHKLNHFMDTFKGDGFFEQSFMNTYFHLNNLSDYSIFTYDNVIMGINDKEPDEAAVGTKRYSLHKTFHSEFEKIKTTIAHFSGKAGDGKSKADMMADYFHKYKQLNPLYYNEYETRNEMIKQLVPEGATIVEIGVFQGEFAEVLADTNPKHLYLVDCWEPQGINSGDVDGNNMKRFSSGVELWNSVKEKYAFYPNISIHRQYSSEFLKSIEDLSIDIIYIDGDHSYEGVKEDLNNAFPKIKKGGWIMGHDYEMNMKKAKYVYNFGVKRAVDEFCLEKGLKVVAKGLDGCVSYAIYIDLEENLDKNSLIDKMLANQFSMVSKERLQGIYDKCSKFKDTDYSFVECGVARGGCLAMIKYAAGPNNKVFGLDSFEGMPDITEKDLGTYNKSDPLKGFGKVGDNLSGGIESVYKTFRELSIDMKNVKLIKGFFEATLNVDENVSAMGKIAILRLDGDWYESTKVCLDKLYSKVIVGGIIIIDDYGHWVGAKRATDEFRAKHNIVSPLIQTDYTEHYWVKNN